MDAFGNKLKELLELDRLIEYYMKEISDEGHSPSEKAVMYYQLGKIEEILNKDQAEATRYYLLAYKQDDTFALPIISAGSILFSNRSVERLIRLYETTYEKISEPALRSAALMFLIEALVLQDEQHPDRICKFLEEIESLGAYPVHSLILQEMEWLKRGNTDEALKALERWKIATENSYVRSQLCLELANIYEKLGNNDLNKEILREAVYNGRDYFPVVLEAIRNSIRTGDIKWLEEIVTDDIDFLMGGGDVNARFLISKPSNGNEAAVYMALLLESIASRTPGYLSNDGIDKIVRVLAQGLTNGVIPASICTLVKIADKSASKETFDSIIQECLKQPLEPVEIAWIKWNKIKSRIVSGDIAGAASDIKEIQKLGFSSDILESMMMLLMFNAENREEILSSMERISIRNRQDPVTTAIYSDMLLSWKNDIGKVVELLSSHEKLSGGLEDLALILAERASNLNLKEKALVSALNSNKEKNISAIYDLLRFYAFEKQDRDKFIETLGMIPSAPRTMSLLSSMIALWLLGGEKDVNKVSMSLKQLAAEVSTPCFYPPVMKRWTNNILKLPFGNETENGVSGIFENDIVRSAIGLHTVLSFLNTDKFSSDIANWLLQQLQMETPQVPISFVVFATYLTAGKFENQNETKKADALLKAIYSSSTVQKNFPDLISALKIMERSPEKILQVATENRWGLSGAIQDGSPEACFAILNVLGKIFIDRDFGNAADIILNIFKPEKMDPALLFTTMMSLMVSGRWREWVDIWMRWKSANKDEALGKYEKEIDRNIFLLGLFSKAHDGYYESKGDPVMLILKLFNGIKMKDIQTFDDALTGLMLLGGGQKERGALSYHRMLVKQITGESLAAEDDTLIWPDILNMDFNQALVRAEGLISLTDVAIEESLHTLRTLKNNEYKVIGLLEFGEFLESAMRTRQALDVYVEALKIDPSCAGAILGLIRTAKPLRDYAMLGWAHELLADIVAGNEKSSEEYFEAAENYKQAKGKEDDALRCYEQSFNLNPGGEKSFHGLMEFLEKKGDRDRLIKLLERRIGIVSDYAELQMLLLKLADLKRQIKDIEGALVAVEDLILIATETSPEKITALRLKMDLLMQTGKYEMAFEVGVQILGVVTDSKIRKGIITNCINLAFQKLNSPEKGLGLCIKLIEEGEGDQEFINKTLRIALKLGKWDDAAKIQDILAQRSATVKERNDNLLKKAEIYLRYARDAEKAEGVYKSILKESPFCWEALSRWQAARGANQIKPNEITEFIDNAYMLIEDDPLNRDTLTFLVRANRIIMNAQAARYFESILDVLSGSEAKKVPAPPGIRTSLPPTQSIPAGNIDRGDIETFVFLDEKLKVIGRTMESIFSAELIDVLKQERMISVPPDIKPEDDASPLSKYLKAWGNAFGLQNLKIFRSGASGEFINILPDISNGLMVGSQTILPLSDIAVFSAGFHIYNLISGLRILSLLQKLDVIKLALCVARVCLGNKFFENFQSRIGKEKIADYEKFAGVISDCIRKETLNQFCDFVEKEGAMIIEDLEVWYGKMYIAALKAGYLASGKILSPIKFLYPDFEKPEQTAPEIIADMIKKDERLLMVLKFAVSRRYEIMRQVLGLNL